MEDLPLPLALRNHLDAEPDQAPLEIPPVDARLIEILEQQFPDQCPRPGLSQDEIWYRAGAASVVNWLKTHQE